MLVSFYCSDKDGDTQAIRQAQLAAHLEWVAKNMHAIKVAGPLKNESAIVGSLYIIEAEDQHAATQILASDPYYLAEIWHDISTEEFNAYAGNWVGGRNWPEF